MPTNCGAGLCFKSSRGSMPSMMMILMLLASSEIALGTTIAFKPAVSYPVGTYPTAVAVGDFNGDGKPDLAVANLGNATGDNGSISILLANGNGTFQPAVNFAGGKNPSAIIAADFNGDKKLDLVVVNADGLSGEVAVLLGKGDGTLQPPVDYAAGNGANAVAVGDFNGDHKLDLAVLNRLDGTVSILLGNGDGTFQSHVDYAAGPGPQAIEVADLDGDGNQDLAVASGQGLTILGGRGDGTFHTVWTSVPLFLVSTSLVGGDFNGDGRFDLIVTGVSFGNATFSNFMVLLGNGDGTLSQDSPVNTGACQNGSPLPADFDGDNKLELAVFTNENCFPNPKNNPTVLIMTGRGDGTFQTAVSFGATQYGLLAAAVDLDGNKSPDLVFVNSATNTISILLNAVSTDFSIAASSPIPSILNPGQQAVSTISLSSLNAFDGPVSLSCSVQPALAGAPTCAVSPTTLTFDADGNASAQLTLKAGTALARQIPAPGARQTLYRRSLWLPVLGFALTGAGLGCRNSRKPKWLIFLFGSLLLGALILQPACGGSTHSSSQPYTVTISGTSGSTLHSTRVMVTVP